MSLLSLYPSRQPKIHEYNRSNIYVRSEYLEVMNNNNFLYDEWYYSKRHDYIYGILWSIISYIYKNIYYHTPLTVRQKVICLHYYHTSFPNNRVLFVIVRCLYWLAKNQSSLCWTLCLFIIFTYFTFKNNFYIGEYKNTCIESKPWTSSKKTYWKIHVFMSCKK